MANFKNMMGKNSGTFFYRHQSSIILIITIFIFLLYFIFMSLSPYLRTRLSDQYLIMVELPIVTAYFLKGHFFFVDRLASIIDNFIYILVDNYKMPSGLSKGWRFVIVLSLLIIFCFDISNPLNAIDEGSVPFLLSAFNLLLGCIILILYGIMTVKIINTFLILRNFVGDVDNLIDSIKPALVIRYRLNDIKDTMLQLILYYFFGIFLLSLTYVNPKSTGYYEITILAILFLLTSIIFFYCLNYVKNIGHSKNKYEIEEINKLIHKKFLYIEPIIIKYDFKREPELLFISNAMDALRKQREDIIQIDERFYDWQTLVRTAGPALLTLLGLTSKLSIEKYVYILIEILSHLFNIFNIGISGFMNYAIGVMADKIADLVKVIH